MIILSKKFVYVRPLRLCGGLGGEGLDTDCNPTQISLGILRAESAILHLKEIQEIYSKLNTYALILAWALHTYGYFI